MPAGFIPLPFPIEEHSRLQIPLNIVACHVRRQMVPIWTVDEKRNAAQSEPRKPLKFFLVNTYRSTQKASSLKQPMILEEQKGSFQAVWISMEVSSMPISLCPIQSKACFWIVSCLNLKKREEGRHEQDQEEQGRSGLEGGKLPVVQIPRKAISRNNISLAITFKESPGRVCFRRLFLLSPSGTCSQALLKTSR